VSWHYFTLYQYIEPKIYREMDYLCMVPIYVFSILMRSLSCM
jgi:hypothetical protein